MKTIIYTFRDHKPVFFKLDRFYYLKSKPELDKLIGSLLEIDAVSTTFGDEVRFPVVVELVEGFTPILRLIDGNKVKKELSALKRILKRAGITD